MCIILSKPRLWQLCRHQTERRMAFHGTNSELSVGNYHMPRPPDDAAVQEYKILAQPGNDISRPTRLTSFFRWKNC